MWGRKLWCILGGALTILGLGGIPDDIATWAKWLAMLELWLDSWWVRVSVAAAGLGIITYPQWLPAVARKLTIGRERGGASEIDKGLAKRLQELVDAIDGEIDTINHFISPSHPMKDALTDSLGDSRVVRFHEESAFRLENLGHTLSLERPKAFKKIEVAFRRYTHPWRAEERCRDIAFFKPTEELEKYGRKDMMIMPQFYEPPEEGISLNVLKKRLIELKAKIGDISA